MSYKEQMQKLADEFFTENGGAPASSRELARWALKNKKWVPPPN